MKGLCKGVVFILDHGIHAWVRREVKEGDESQKKW